MADPFPSSCSPDGATKCRSFMGSPLAFPDLIMSAGSPVVPTPYPRGGSPGIEYSVELSLEDGIRGSSFEEAGQDLAADSSFELVPQLEKGQVLEEDHAFGIGINVGSSDESVVLDGAYFSEDCGFVGGNTVRRNDMIEDGRNEGFDLYQTARVGDFSYFFRVEPGEYAVCLHLAEIVFIEGPIGIRVFDVFIQDEKVVSGLDIFAQVGANKPLVISDIKASVHGQEGLRIRFQGVTGSPIVCGLSIVKDSSSRSGEAEPLVSTRMPQIAEHGSTDQQKKKRVRWEDETDYEGGGDYPRLLQDFNNQKRELEDIRSAFAELKKDNHLKSRECQDAWKSMRELQNELMRKSMHVGSLAFAIEGQVKEKSKWFTTLRNVTRRLKIMKMEHVKLSEEASLYRSCLAEITEMKFTIQATMKQQVDMHEDLKIKYIRGAKERKELYNKVLELKGNIRVFCRCRPLNAEEVAVGASMSINLDSAKDGELTVTSNGISKKSFKFDAVFGPQADQADVFEETAPFATSVLDGYNVCIFAYGQTGTGKTFTMEGLEGARGVNFRTLEEVFNIIKERKHQYRYEVSVSVLEIYNEQIRDLLVSASHQGGAAKRLEVRQNGDGLHHVPGLVEAPVSNMSEAWEVLKTGSNARAVGSTNANERSSRSHCMHYLMVKGENLLTGECTRSKLWLVDLAGSERVAKTEVQGERLKETQNINRSLSALGDVIAALATRSPHIPFRNSKLTHLLQDSLGGDSKTLMFVQISPNENDLGETLCSLNFASRARGIELGPPKRQLDVSELLKYKQTAEKLKLDLKSKDVQIKKMEETINGLDLKIKEKDFKNKNLHEKVKELESQLLVERKLARQHVDTRIAEQHQQQQIRQQNENSAPPKPQLATRLLFGSHKSSTEPVNGAPSQKDIINPFQPLAENNSCNSASALPSADSIFNCIDPTEKENNPPEFFQLPKRTGRASLYIAAQQVPMVSAPRRNSLIPLPSISSLCQTPVPPQPLLPAFPLGPSLVREDTDEGSAISCLPEQARADSPITIKSATKKLSSILRKSVQKKVQPKSSPVLQHHLRKGGINVGSERLRVSIGSRGKLLGNARRVLGTKEAQKKSKRDKERGWNVGTASRTAI